MDQKLTPIDIERALARNQEKSCHIGPSLAKYYINMVRRCAPDYKQSSKQLLAKHGSVHTNAHTACLSELVKHPGSRLVNTRHTAQLLAHAESGGMSASHTYAPAARMKCAAFLGMGSVWRLRAAHRCLTAAHPCARQACR